MPFLSNLWARLIGIISAIVAGFLAFIYIRKKHIEQGVNEQKIKNIIYANEALRNANQAEKDFRGTINEKEINNGIKFMRDTDFMQWSYSPSSRDQ